MRWEGGETMTKLRVLAVLLIGTFGALMLAAGAMLAPLGLSDGGGFG